MLRRRIPKINRWALGLALLPGLLLAARPAASETAGALVFDEADAALDARLQLIGQAEHEIDVMVYQMNMDEAAALHLAALRAAARRGVRVRILLDGVGSMFLTRPPMAHLEQEGIAFRLYHPWPSLRPRRWTRRLHDKLLRVDDRVLLIGGRSITDRFYGPAEAEERRVTLDREALVTGPVVDAARTYFETVWTSNRVRPPQSFAWMEDAPTWPDDFAFGDGDPRAPGAIRRAVARADLDRVAQALDRAEAEIERRLPAEPHRLPDPTEAEFLESGVSPSAEHTIAHDIHVLLGEARESMVIEMPYFIPTRAFLHALDDALDRGVRVEVLVNSLQSTMNFLAHAAYVNRRPSLARRGVRLWEYRGPEALHAKTFVLDGRVTVIGSYNVNRRSETRDTESVVVIDDPEVAAAVAAIIAERMERADLVCPERGTPVGGRHPGARFRRRAATRFLQVFTRLIARQI